MDPKTIEWTKEMREKFVKNPGRVLEVGSLDVNGSVRHLFGNLFEYIGLDMRAGKSVDLVLNGHDLYPYFLPKSFDTVICLNMLEHDDAFWITLANINKVLKKRGWFFVSVPTFGFPIHDYPRDYWRFGEEAFKDIILKGFEILDMTKVFTKELKGEGINPVINCLGKKL